MALTLTPLPFTRDSCVTVPGAGSGKIDSFHVDSIHVEYREKNSAP
jgi:hypothetical protein